MKRSLIILSSFFATALTLSGQAPLSPPAPFDLGAATQETVAIPKAPLDIPALLKDLWSENESERTSATRKLISSKDSGVSSILSEILKKSQPKEKAGLLCILLRRGEKGLASQVGLFKDNSDPMLRMKVAYACRYSVDPALGMELVKWLEDKDPLVVEYSVASLGRIGDASSLSALQDFQKKDKSPLIQLALGKSIASLSPSSDSGMVQP